MPISEVVRDYTAALAQYGQAVDDLGRQFALVALATLADVLPGATAVEAFGELNEDWIPTLRIRRARSADGEVLFDADRSDSPRAVDDVVDEVDIDKYLDRLIDVAAASTSAR